MCGCEVVDVWMKIDLFVISMDVWWVIKRVGW